MAFSFANALLNAYGNAAKKGMDTVNKYANDKAAGTSKQQTPVNQNQQMVSNTFGKAMGTVANNADLGKQYANRINNQFAAQNRQQDLYQAKVDEKEKELADLESKIQNQEPGINKIKSRYAESKNALDHNSAPTMDQINDFNYGFNAMYRGDNGAQLVNPTYKTDAQWADERERQRLKKELAQYKNAASQVVATDKNGDIITDINGNPLMASTADEKAEDQGVSDEAIKTGQEATQIDPETGERIWTVAGEQVSDADDLGLLYAQYLSENPELYGKYGDDWSKFQRLGTEEEWQDVFNSDMMSPYYQYITNDDQFFTDGKFDMDKYWAYSQDIDPFQVATMDDLQRQMLYGDSAASINAMNNYLAEQMDAGLNLDPNSGAIQMLAERGLVDPNNLESASWYGYGMPLDMNYEFSDEAAKWFEQPGNLMQDFEGNQYFRGFDENQIQNMLNQQALQYGMLNRPNYAYNLDEANWLAGLDDVGWGREYTYNPADGASRDYGLPDNLDLNAYNPYALNADWIYNMATGGNFDPTGAIAANYYGPEALYYLKNA